VSEAREITIELGVVEASQPRKLPDRGGSLGLGDRIYVRLTRQQSKSQRRLYAHVFNVGVRGKVSLLTAATPTGLALDKGDEFVLGTDDATGELTGLGLFWPEGLAMDSFPRTDEIVVIVTTTPVSLTALVTKEHITRSATRARGTGLQDMLAQLHDGLTREIGGPAQIDAFLVKRLTYFLHPRAGRIGEIDFEIDENPTLQLGTRSAGAWLESGERAAVAAPPVIAAPPPSAVAIRLAELVVERNRALFAADVRIDALVCTRAAAADRPYAVKTFTFPRIKSGERLPLDNALLFAGPAHDFVDLCLWVSRDTDQSLQLAELLAARAKSPEFTDAATALAIAGGAAAAPWVAAVGASAVLARIAYELLLQAAGKAIGLYRTSFLAHEHYGVGRHPVQGLYRAQDFSFSLLIEAV
jgi:hypothetical protein